MEKKGSVKSSFDSALNTAGKIGKLAFDNIVLPLVTGGTSKAAQLLGKLGPKALKGLSLLGAPGIPTKKQDKTWLYILIGIIVIFFLPILVIMMTTSAFVSPQGLGSLENLPGASVITPAPLQCSNARHEAEKIICWLKEGYLQTSNNCPQSFQSVIKSNYNLVSSCITSPKNSGNPITNPNVVDSEFRASVNLIDPDPRYLGKLQCVGFIKATEMSLGHPIDTHNAKDYWLQNCHQEYERITTTIASSLKPGDLAVRTTDRNGNPSPYGHISIIIETVGNIKIIVAEALGTNGEILLEEEAVTNYNGFLRYKY